ncbi:unnamed protein product [Chilo suppressalis]|uniref:RNA methyltransferase n=1 Tax=Chilo suppressalis TaxID=168631 RepID=A0ABN8LAZ8_CHISP|nr:unnamed protein product [Chilo suppressalis]
MFILQNSFCNLKTIMATKELTFIGEDPGAVKHGNFINYYTFHSPTERIQNLHPSMFPSDNNQEQQIVCLDIGCNSGELTKEINGYMRTIYPEYKILILAIDIDPILIERAQKFNGEPEICYKRLDIMDKRDHIVIQDYLSSHGKKTFDITFCFSVTMWIHLNNGDKGLLEFLKYLKNNSRTLIIEPQPWNCYRNAQRRLKKSGSLFPFYENLEIRSNICNIIEKELSKETHKKVHESSASNWKRKIQCYQVL